MENSEEHAKAVARRILIIRILGVVLLATILWIENAHINRLYTLLCAGCALIQLAHLGFPQPASIVGPARISVLQLMQPRRYLLLFLGTKGLAWASLAIELFVGFHFLNWKTVLFMLVGVTAAVDMLATRITFALSGIAGMALTLVACGSLFSPTYPLVAGAATSLLIFVAWWGSDGGVVPAIPSGAEAAEPKNRRYTIAQTLRALGVLVVAYFILGALLTWGIERRYPTLYRWSGNVTTFVFLLFVLMGTSEIVKGIWWRSGQRDRRGKNS